MGKTVISFALCALLPALCVSANAQQPAKVANIGWLGTFSVASDTGREFFGRELRALGYLEGKNIAIEYRYADNKVDRLPALANELIDLKVAVLVTPATATALAAKNATRTTPIAFLTVADPVASGLIDSLARPGGNITGFTTIEAVLAGKRLELLKEAIPKLSRVAVLWNPRDPNSTFQWKES